MNENSSQRLDLSEIHSDVIYPAIVNHFDTLVKGLCNLYPKLNSGLFTTGLHKLTVNCNGINAVIVFRHNNTNILYLDCRVIVYSNKPTIIEINDIYTDRCYSVLHNKFVSHPILPDHSNFKDFPDFKKRPTINSTEHAIGQYNISDFLTIFLTRKFIFNPSIPDFEKAVLNMLVF